MKTFLPMTVALVLLGTTGTLLLASGCAATTTRQSTGEYFDSAALTAKVKSALFQDPVVSGFDVGVETFRGQVQLSGFVDTPEQKSRAEQIARTVPGVTDVGNNLGVKTAGSTNPGVSTPATTNTRAQTSQAGATLAPAGSTERNAKVDPTLQSAARSIRQIWDANPDLAKLDLRVAAENGRLIFRGTVPNTDLWVRAKESAEGVVRGLDIENLISIGQPAR